jgi:peptidoglycan pentaglycine glycine transferase (the first glycine)
MTHFLQSKQWKEVKKNLGNEVFSIGSNFFQTTKLPFINKSIGYMPRALLKDIDFDQLEHAAKKAGCIFVTLDPLDLYSQESIDLNSDKFKSGEPVHLQETVVIDLTKPEEEIMNLMKQKHRYNVRLAQKKGVTVEIDYSQKSFESFMTLYSETVSRQKYHGRSESYVRTVWETLKDQEKSENFKLVAIATAFYENKPHACWMLILFEDTIYYLYGGSSEENKNVMSTYALVCGIIQWGKENSYAKLDLFGIKTTPNQSDGSIEYDGYSKFKTGFGGDIVKYADTIDFVVDPTLYSLVKLALKVRNKLVFKN